MASLLHGPKLGNPAASGFTVWVHVDVEVSLTLETREDGETAWAVQDTQAALDEADNQATFTATGLTAGTKYYYRVLEGTTALTTEYTYTMPTSGRFIMYQMADTHNGTSYVNNVLTDWEANYEPLGIPAFILMTGDFYDMVTLKGTRQEVLDTYIYPGLADCADALKRIPFVYMWDDWDFAGNNSAKFNMTSYQDEDEPLEAVKELYDRVWAQPIHAAPSKGFLLEVAGVPIIVTDQRSERVQYGASPYSNPNPVFGDEELQDNVTAWGLEQREWIVEKIREYRDRGLVLVVNGTVVRGRTFILPPSQPDFSRDSTGLWYGSELNYVLETARDVGLMNGPTKLCFLTGDDHYNAALLNTSLVPSRLNAQYYPTPTGIAFREFKVDSGGFTADAFCRWDVTSAQGGVRVAARITWIHVSGSQDPPGAWGILPTVEGNVGDLYYENGYLMPYDELDRKYPPDCGQHGFIRFQRTFTDDITGFGEYEDVLTRDRQERLVAYRDSGELDRDDLLDTWDYHHERPEEIVE